MQTNSKLFAYLKTIAAENATNFIGKAKIRPVEYFLPTQANWIFDNSKRKFCVKGRQFGWSDITGLRAALILGFSDVKRDTWAASRDQTQAGLLVEDVSRWCDVICEGGFAKSLITSSSQDCLAFTNGNRFHSLSSNPDAQAGKRGNRILDEFALHEQQEKLLAIALPGTDWGGSLEIISTPRGTDTVFHKLQMDIEHNGNPQKFSYYKVTLEKMLNEGLLYKRQCILPHDDPIQQMDEAEYFDYKRRECGDDEIFNQEYMCVSSDEQSAFLSYDLITAAEFPVSLSSSGGEGRGEEAGDSKNSQSSDWSCDASELSENSELFLGVDIGRDHDLTVFWLLDKRGSTYHTVGIEVFDKEPFEKQEAALYELLSLPLVKRCCIDQTGIGRQFTERAQNRFGKYKVEGITFTQAMKEELAYPVRMAFEDRTIKIPSQPEIRTDLRAIKKETTASGNIRFTADRSASGHSDRFWALALALHATKRKSAPLEITIGY
ncbi:MAG: hypothetical protein JWO95_670 [Verrucomicrobiales bacterium]|nr:hypothetical protein [Verrucomicrobiales bacterium]